MLSPHCADRVEGWLTQATRLFVGNWRRFQAGHELLNAMDKHRRY